MQHKGLYGGANNAVHSAQHTQHTQHTAHTPRCVDTQTHVAEGEPVTDENPILARRDARRVRNADVVFLEPGRERE